MYDIDYSLWAAYLAECEATGTTPTQSDYSVFLSDADLDREEDYDWAQNE